MEHGERQRKITFHPINFLIRRVRSWLESTANWKSFRAFVFDNVIFNHNSIASSFDVRSSSTGTPETKAPTLSLPRWHEICRQQLASDPEHADGYLGRSIYPFRVDVLPTLDRILNEAWDKHMHRKHWEWYIWIDFWGCLNVVVSRRFWWCIFSQFS